MSSKDEMKVDIIRDYEQGVTGLLGKQVKAKVISLMNHGQYFPHYFYKDPAIWSSIEAFLCNDKQLLCITGGLGSGKTSLLSHIAHHKSEDHRVIFLSAENFTLTKNGLVDEIGITDPAILNNILTYSGTSIILIDELECMNASLHQIKLWIKTTLKWLRTTKIKLIIACPELFCEKAFSGIPLQFSDNRIALKPFTGEALKACIRLYKLPPSFADELRFGHPFTLHLICRLYHRGRRHQDAVPQEIRLFKLYERYMMKLRLKILRNYTENDLRVGYLPLELGELFYFDRQYHLPQKSWEYFFSVNKRQLNDLVEEQFLIRTATGFKINHKPMAAYLASYCASWKRVRMNWSKLIQQENEMGRYIILLYVSREDFYKRASYEKKLDGFKEFILQHPTNKRAFDIFIEVVCFLYHPDSYWKGIEEVINACRELWDEEKERLLLEVSRLSEENKEKVRKLMILK